MNIASRKAKGRRLQNRIRDDLRNLFPMLEDDDIQSQTMGMSGADIVLSPAARKLINYSIECKNQETLPLWKSLQQAADNAGEQIPLLIFKRNHSKTYVTLEWDKFMDMLNV
jgi:hypothetical protein